MAKASRGFQVFAKPVGSLCNLSCRYCYYLQTERLYPNRESLRMADDILERYIVQHIEACPDEVIRFSWHGGEPLMLGLDYFRKITEVQRRHQPLNQRIANGIQTNGTLLDEQWCCFLAAEGFAVGLSIDGPKEMHDRYRVTKDGRPTHEQAIRGYRLLQEHRVYTDILCVVNADNVRHPADVYRFFKQIEAPYVSFLPLVESRPDTETGVSPLTVPAETWGDFLCAIFDEWVSGDIGRIKVQIFEEAARTAFGQHRKASLTGEHSLCIFRPTCGDIPVVEHNGDFYSCDHFVNPEHCVGNIHRTSLVELLESPAQKAFGQAKLETLPQVCLSCDVRAMCNGECPKNRFCRTPDGQAGLNYLCSGYKRFFTHCRPFVSQVGAAWRQQNLERRVPAIPAKNPQAGHAPGRNDPCPCGSGLKYKKCCLKNSED